MEMMPARRIATLTRTSIREYPLLHANILTGKWTAKKVGLIFLISLSVLSSLVLVSMGETGGGINTYGEIILPDGCVRVRPDYVNRRVF